MLVSGLLLAVPAVTGQWSADAVAYVSIDLGEAPAAAPVTARLAGLLGDRSLQICVRPAGSDDWADEPGRAVELPAAVGHDRTHTDLTLDDGARRRRGGAGPNASKSPAVRGFSSAPERTRTSTDHTVHKALNLARLPIPPQALGAASIASVRGCPGAIGALSVRNARFCAGDGRARVVSVLGARYIPEHMFEPAGNPRQDEQGADGWT
jgi:hypothetical protein